ncbi:MAG: glycosyl hydrolase family 18 protein [Lachnospiraceae bacterium]|nr:glycosyl hydrolase family 18 protein [Lachnospiraceae bacterium]
MSKKKSILPVILCATAIAVIGGVGVVGFGHFSSTGKRMNPFSYYGMEASDEAAVIVNDKVLDEKGITRDGRIYLNYKTVWDYIDCGYYWDASLRQLFLTLPGETLSWSPDDGSGSVLEDGENTWIAADLIREQSDVDLSVLEEPSRVVVRSRWQDLSTCTVTKKAQIRYRGGRKSEVLTEAAAGDTVVLLDTVDEWSHVSTADGYIGYVKSELLTADAEPALSHVTDSRFIFDKVKVEEPVVMGWHYIDAPANNQYLKERIEGVTGLNTISPTWFSMEDLGGNVSSYASADYVTTAHEAGLKVWGMLGDVGGQTVRTGEVLADSTARANVINQLIQAAAETGMDGINVDLETITEAEAPQYLQFLKELSLAAHQNGLVVSVDNFVPTYTWYYRRREQAKCVDYVVIMGYDEHTATSEEIGSVASIGFVQQGIEDTLREVDPSSVINGVPLYGRCWVERYGSTVPDTQALAMDAQQQFVSEHGITLEWDASVGQNVGSSDDGSARYSIWMEDSDSMSQRLEMMKTYNLAGVACWRLGLENPEIWNVIASAMQG